LPARELLPGDVVELHVGDSVPADLRLVKLKTATLRCEQASLTGESVAVQKSTEALTDEDCELQVLATTCTPPLGGSRGPSAVLEAWEWHQVLGCHMAWSSR
jgi:magnesium-transporting ATPase (P-type)